MLQAGWRPKNRGLISSKSKTGFLLLNVQIGSRTLPPSSLVGKASRQFDHWPTTNAKFQHACSRICSPPYAFMAYIGNFTYLEEVSRAIYPLWIKSFSISAIYCSRIDRGLILINRNLQLVLSEMMACGDTCDSVIARTQLVL